MKTVFCFGDSNTFGFNPSNGARYDKNTRWTGVLQKLSGEDYKIIEAGCNNRTCFSNNPDGVMFTGCKILPELLSDDFDIVVLSIGINDLQFQYNPPIEQFKSEIEKLIDMVINACPHSKIILTAPSIIKENILKSYFSTMFDKNSVEKSKELPKIYEKAAKNKDCIFIDLNKIANVSDVDGLHYEAGEHQKIANAIAQLILKP